MTETAVCTERHRRIDERLDTQDKRINNHSDRLDKVEQFQSRTETKIENLCERIDGLISVMNDYKAIFRWLVGTSVGALVSFFFYAIQKGIFK